MEKRSHRKTRTGIVLSDKMNKTIVVRVKRTKMHPVYKRIIIASKKFKVHDEKNEAKIGDTVLIMETKPISKDKHFRLVEIVKK